MPHQFSVDRSPAQFVYHIIHDSLLANKITLFEVLTATLQFALINVVPEVFRENSSLRVMVMEVDRA